MRADVSLLVPCFNAEAYIADVIKAARAQTAPYLEIICYDDGSIDRTADVARAAGVTVVRSEENRGPAHARRQLLANAQGRYVHFHDADDILFPAFVERLRPLLDEGTAAVCARSELSETGILRTCSLAGVPFENARELVLKHFIHFNQTIFPAESLRCHMKLADDLPILEDRLAFLSVAAGGLRFRYLDEALTTYVRRENSITKRQSHMEGMQALQRFWRHAVPYAGDLLPLLAANVRWTCWRYYLEDASVYAEVRNLLRMLKQSGLPAVDCAGWKAGALSALLPAEMVFWLRRQWAIFRTVS